MPSPLAAWHALVASKDAAALDALVAEDAVFYSPAVHTPQKGRALTCAYLRAALVVFDGVRYTNEWVLDRSAVLEFELEIDGFFVNGVDMIHWNDDGLITEFKVMVRPKKGLDAVIARMAAQLASK